MTSSFPSLVALPIGAPKGVSTKPVSKNYDGLKAFLKPERMPTLTPIEKFRFVQSSIRDLAYGEKPRISAKEYLQKVLDTGTFKLSGQEVPILNPNNRDELNPLQVFVEAAKKRVGPAAPLSIKAIEEQERKRWVKRFNTPSKWKKWWVSANLQAQEEAYAANVNGSNQHTGSMSSWHRFLITSDASWDKFNAIAFGLNDDMKTLTADIKFLKEMRERAWEFIQFVDNQDATILETQYSLFLHPFPFNTQPALHLHMVKNDGYEKLAKANKEYFKECEGKNLKLDDLIEELEGRLSALEDLSELEERGGQRSAWSARALAGALFGRKKR